MRVGKIELACATCGLSIDKVKLRAMKGELTEKEAGREIIALIASLKTEIGTILTTLQEDCQKLLDAVEEK